MEVSLLGCASEARLSLLILTRLFTNLGLQAVRAICLTSHRSLETRFMAQNNYNYLVSIFHLGCMNNSNSFIFIFILPQ